MAQIRSPLAETSLNTPAITPHRIDFGVADENRPFEVHSGSKGYTFANDVETSPTKSRSSSIHRSPRKTHHKVRQPVPLTEDALIKKGLAKDQIAEYRSHDEDIDAASNFSGITGYPGMDDTAFSTFSAVPPLDTTELDCVGQSPPRRGPNKASSHEPIRDSHSTPQTNGLRTPLVGQRILSDEDSPSPTPRPRTLGKDSDDTTNLILDFTEQFSAFSQSSKHSPTRNARPSPRKFPTQPNLASFASGKRTPSPAKHMLPPSTPSEVRHLANLLDFDIPPAPTPRSIPSITARELEGLKSKFLSEISSLRATISGKTAEIDSLKAAVEDAERRVGEALEEIRDERGAKESLVAEKVDWQKRDKELQGLLREVKDEINTGEQERQELYQRAKESDKRAEEAMRKVSVLERRSADMQSGTQSNNTSDQLPEAFGDQNSSISEEQEEVIKQRITLDLHGKYKIKHENKVTYLKKKYEAQWKDRVQHLENELEDMTKENEDLKLAKDTTFSELLPGTLTPAKSEVRQELVIDTQLLEDHKAKLAILTEEISTIKQDNKTLCEQLERERSEKGELVAAVEEMLSMQASSAAPPTEAAPAENLRGSFSRASGLKGPGFGGSKMPLPGLNRSVSGGARGIMSNIERMGRGRGGE